MFRSNRCRTAWARWVWAGLTVSQSIASIPAMCESESRLARARESGEVGDVAQVSSLACVETTFGKKIKKIKKLPSAIRFICAFMLEFAFSCD